MYSRKSLAAAVALLLLVGVGCDSGGGGGLLSGLDNLQFDWIQARGTLRDADSASTIQEVNLHLDLADNHQNEADRVSAHVVRNEAAAQIPLAVDTIYRNTLRRGAFSIEIVRQTVPRTRYVASDLRIKIVNGSTGATMREIQLPEKTADLAVGESLTWEFEL